MNRVMNYVGSLVVSLVASTSWAETTTMEEAAGQQVFAHRCHACHSEDTSKNTFGPRLVGVVGRKAASLPRFAYSKALKESGLVWTEDNLRKWVADNVALVPGTRMRHVSVTDPAEQDFLIAFLKSMK